MEIIIFFGKALAVLSAIITAGYGTLAIRWFIVDRKDSDTSTECRVGLHESCTSHFNCACRHHDRIIMKEMSR